MANMSYCRFENTAGDMADCMEALRNGEGDDESLSEYERAGKKRLIALAREMVEWADNDAEEREADDAHTDDGES